MHKTSKIIGLSLIACLGLVSSLEAGRISTQLQGAPSNAPGFNGWNLNNVDVVIADIGTNYADNGKKYNKVDGSYDPSFGEGNTFESVIKDENGVVTGRLHGKDWPVGEPDGIKVLHNIAGVANGKPENCIINTSYLDEATNPNDGHLDAVAPAVATPLDCAGPWQSHKRFKINFQPSTVAGGVGNEKSVDIVFNIQEETGVRRYQVFQKLDNYTGKRLKGYSVEVGIGIGSSFVATPDDITISLGLGENAGKDIWDAESLATFSHGLWGGPDDHFANNGFFDEKPSGYYVTLEASNKKFISGATLGSDYVDIFGEWLPSIWAPEGIFYDFDNDPDTDADLEAFWSDWDGTKNTGVFGWRQGYDHDFLLVPTTTLYEWAANPLYAVDVVEDTLNLGINFIIEVGNLATPSSTFTIRYTPILDTNQIDPVWISSAPVFNYTIQTGVISISPEPTFTPGTPLTIRLADADLNLAADVNDTYTLNVTNDNGESEEIIMMEMDVNTSIFQAILNTTDTTNSGTDNDGTLHVTEGTIVTVQYDDANTSNGTTDTVIATTTAQTPPPPPTVDSGDDPISTATTADVNNDDDKGIFAAMDNTSLFAMIFGFLAIGGLIARRKLAK